MKPPANPPYSILYIWDDRTLSFGENRPLSPHLHGAAELAIALEFPFETVIDSKTRIETKSLLIPPNVQHKNTHKDPICPILYLDPEGRDYQLLKASLGQQGDFIYDLPFEGRAREILTKIYHDVPKADECYELIQKLLFGNEKPIRAKIDPRIRAVLSTIHGDYSRNYSIDSLALEVNLSKDRLLHLFKEQIGIPYRKYRAWARLKQVAKLAFQGNSLTDSAHEAGFADSSHYIKTFHRHFGTQPSEMLFNRKNLKVIFE